MRPRILLKRRRMYIQRYRYMIAHVISTTRRMPSDDRFMILLIWQAISLDGCNMALQPHVLCTALVAARIHATDSHNHNHRQPQTATATATGSHRQPQSQPQAATDSHSHMQPQRATATAKCSHRQPQSQPQAATES